MKIRPINLLLFFTAIFTSNLALGMDPIAQAKEDLTTFEQEHADCQQKLNELTQKIDGAKKLTPAHEHQQSQANMQLKNKENELKVIEQSIQEHTANVNQLIQDLVQAQQSCREEFDKANENHEAIAAKKAYENLSALQEKSIKINKDFRTAFVNAMKKFKAEHLNEYNERRALLEKELEPGLDFKEKQRLKELNDLFDQYEQKENVSALEQQVNDLDNQIEVITTNYQKHWQAYTNAHQLAQSQNGKYLIEKEKLETAQRTLQQRQQEINDLQQKINDSQNFTKDLKDLQAEWSVLYEKEQHLFTQIRTKKSTISQLERETKEKKDEAENKRHEQERLQKEAEEKRLEQEREQAQKLEQARIDQEAVDKAEAERIAALQQTPQTPAPSMPTNNPITNGSLTANPQQAQSGTRTTPPATTSGSATASKNNDQKPVQNGTQNPPTPKELWKTILPISLIIGIPAVVSLIVLIKKIVDKQKKKEMEKHKTSNKEN